MKINPNNATDVVCEKCGHRYFVQVFAIKRIDKLYTGSAKDEIFPLETFACQKCGHINEEFQVAPNDGKPKIDTSSTLLVP